MQLRQNTRPVPRRELHGLEFSASIGPHAEVELVRIHVAAENRRGTFEVRRDVVRVRDGKRGRIESENGDAGNAENPLVAAAPRVLNDHIPRQVLGLFERRGSGINGGGGVGSVFHDRRRVKLDRAVEIGCVAAHGFDLGEMREGVNTWRIVEAEEEPESLLLRRWRCRPRRWASERPRVIRRLAGGNHRTYGGGFLAVSAVLRGVV